MSEMFICPKCKGKKHVFNPECFLLTVAMPLVFLLENDEDASDRTLSKKPCSTCRGRGFVKFEDDED